MYPATMMHLNQHFFFSFQNYTCKCPGQSCNLKSFESTICNKLTVYKRKMYLSWCHNDMGGKQRKQNAIDIICKRILLHISHVSIKTHKPNQLFLTLYNFHAVSIKNIVFFAQIDVYSFGISWKILGICLRKQSHYETRFMMKNKIKRNSSFDDVFNDACYFLSK